MRLTDWCAIGLALVGASCTDSASAPPRIPSNAEPVAVTHVSVPQLTMPVRVAAVYPSEWDAIWSWLHETNINGPAIDMNANYAVVAASGPSPLGSTISIEAVYRTPDGRVYVEVAEKRGTSTGDGVELPTDAVLVPRFQGVRSMVGGPLVFVER